MTSATYSAAMMDAETGGNKTYSFDAHAGLMEMPATEIIEAFIKHLDVEGDYPAPMTCRIESSVKKTRHRVVLATGALILEKGEIPFLLMISPQIRERMLDHASG